MYTFVLGIWMEGFVKSLSAVTIYNWSYLVRHNKQLSWTWGLWESVVSVKWPPYIPANKVRFSFHCVLGLDSSRHGCPETRDQVVKHRTDEDWKADQLSTDSPTTPTPMDPQALATQGQLLPSLWTLLVTPAPPSILVCIFTECWYVPVIAQGTSSISHQPHLYHLFTTLARHLNHSPSTMFFWSRVWAWLSLLGKTQGHFQPVSRYTRS